MAIGVQVNVATKSVNEKYNSTHTHTVLEHNAPQNHIATKTETKYWSPIQRRLKDSFLVHYTHYNMNASREKELVPRNAFKLKLMTHTVFPVQ